MMSTKITVLFRFRVIIGKSVVLKNVVEVKNCLLLLSQFTALNLNSPKFCCFSFHCFCRYFKLSCGTKSIDQVQVLHRFFSFVFQNFQGGIGSGYACQFYKIRQEVKCSMQENNIGFRLFNATFLSEKKPNSFCDYSSRGGFFSLNDKSLDFFFLLSAKKETKKKHNWKKTVLDRTDKFLPAQNSSVIGHKNVGKN